MDAAYNSFHLEGTIQTAFAGFKTMKVIRTERIIRNFLEKI